jgi:hypothetical protein
MTELAKRMPLRAVIAEYEHKLENLETNLLNLKVAIDNLEMAASVRGTYGCENIHPGRLPSLDTLKTNLLHSAWLTLWQHPDFNIKQVATAADQKKLDFAISNGLMVDFTLENIRASFGDYIANPRYHILRGLAEVFSELDPSFKSHEKVKIGVKGLAKRIIVRAGDYPHGYGAERIRDAINALAALTCLPPVDHDSMRDLWADENALFAERGVRLRRHKNGNGHLFFSPATLLTVNRALAEFYGEVLADCNDDETPQHNTTVAKSLQYYPTPEKVVDVLINHAEIRPGMTVLEPSAGCGRIMSACKEKGVSVHGVEIDPGRAAQCRANGHRVIQTNFLSLPAMPIYDRVIMNPPFFGRHYAKHVAHAMAFLKPGGRLISVLPITARYDHGLLAGGWWHDLPVGSFAESGTSINTTIFVKHVA